MSETSMLSCPFCGGEGKLYDDYSSERDEHRWQVWHVCDNGPEGESAGYGKAYHTSIDTPWFKSREKAVEAWNTRSVTAAAVMGYEAAQAERTCRNTTFKQHHMEELRRLGMGGYPCATFAAREIEQLNVYAYALERALMFGFSNPEEVREMIMKMRETFAPDVDMPELKGAM